MSRRDRSSSGFGAVGLLAAVAILAIAAAVALGVSHGSSGAGKAGASTTLGTSPAQASNDISAAARVTCQTDYQAVQQAADAYTADQGHPPGAMSDLAGMLRDPVTSPYFTISIGSTGQIEVATPGHAATPGAGNCAFAP